MLTPLPAGPERRASPRLPMRLPVGYHAVATHPPVRRRGMTLDVSDSGVRFRTHEEIPAGSFMVMELALPRRLAHTSRARTIWVRQMPGEGDWEVGAAFLRKEGGGDAEFAELLYLGA